MKIIYTGPTCYLGQWHFTKCKTYDIHLYERSVHYIIADNDKRYYINCANSRSKAAPLAFDKTLEIVDSLGSNFMTLEQWRDNQLNKVGI